MKRKKIELNVNVNERLNISLCNCMTVFVACCRSIYDCICQAHSMLSFAPRATKKRKTQSKWKFTWIDINSQSFNVRNVYAPFIWMSLNLILVNWEMPFVTILIFTVHQDTVDTVNNHKRLTTMSHQWTNGLGTFGAWSRVRVWVNEEIISFP